MPYLAKIAKRISIAWVATTLVGCVPQDSPSTAPADDTSPARISVFPESASVEQGDTATFRVTVTNRKGEVLTGHTPTWRSSNDAIATVDASGTATVTDTGTVTLVARVASLETTARVQGKRKAVAKVIVTPGTVSLQVGGSDTLAAATYSSRDQLLTGRTITWASGNAAVASVDLNGRVRAISAGNATIYATSEGVSGTAVVTVSSIPVPATVVDLRVSAVTDSSATLAFTEVGDGLGGAASYDIRFAPGALAWGSATSVSRGTCASPMTGTTVGAARTCTILGLSASTAYQFQLVSFRGTLNVNATFGQLSGLVGATTAALPVVPVASVTVTPGSATAQVGATTTFAATTRDASGNVLTGRTITWSSSNTAIATVNASGVVTAVAAGTATIRATSGTIQGTAAMTVTAPSPATVASVAVNPASASAQVGATASFTATTRDSAGNVLTGRTITWSSSNTAVATVNASGVASAVAAGTATIRATSGSVQGSATMTVTAPPVTGNPPEPVPGSTGDIVVYDDNMSGYSTMAARHARRAELLAGSAPFYFFDGPDAGLYREADDAIIAGGVDGSPYAYRISVRPELNNFYQASMYGEVFHRSALAGGAHFNPAGTTLVVDLWVRTNYPASNLLWIKGLELFHNYDRTQYGVYLTSGSLGWANIHPQSNGREIYMHLEDGAADAPKTYRRWSDISTGQWQKHTFVYKPSTGTGTQRDGINRWYVNGELIIDASQRGMTTGWIKDRIAGVSATSTNPFPGNVGDKYSSVTADQAVLGMADDPVIQMIWPGIISTSAAGGGGTIDLGRIRIWYRPNQ